MDDDAPISLVHYSRKPLAALRFVKQVPSQTGVEKPSGLWVTVEGEGGWADWCNRDGFLYGSLCYEIRLAPAARILHLGTAEEIDWLTEEFGVPALIGFSKAIDWPRIAERYQGILIIPYIWARRMTMHTMWYYGWDCASGCIWNPDAIESVTLRQSSPGNTES